MLIISWNVKTNNAGNFGDRYNPMCQAIYDQYGEQINSGAPWVLAVLENKSGGTDIGNNLCARLGGQWSFAPSLGGGAHTTENVILIGGNCAVTAHGANTDWKNIFNTRLQTSHASAIAQVHDKFANGARSMRASTQMKSIATVENDNPWVADNCRNPYLIEIAASTGTFRLGFVHSPGPQEKVSYHDDSYASLYFESILTALKDRSLNCLIGDFNIYGSEPVDPTKYGLYPVGKNMGGTTFDGEGGVGNSRLDRAYVASGHALHSPTALLNGSNVVSDHLGLGVSLQTLKTAQDSSGIQFNNAPNSPSSSSASSDDAMDIS